MKIRYALWAAAFLTILNIHAPAATHYVSLSSTNPVPPYASWSTAATNIQDAVDGANPNDTVLVTNGIYQTGSRADENGVSNRLAVTKPLTIQSVNGPQVTVIKGDHIVWIVYPYIFSGTDVRCVYLTNGATLSGFTLTSATSTDNGGGAFCESTNVILINCLVVGNSATTSGGGVYGGTLIDCSVSNNNAGLPYYGGGVYGSVLTNCVLNNNSAFIGGGAEGSALYNCIVSGNSGQASGTDRSMLNNCILCNNLDGAADAGTLNNCVLYGNLSYVASGCTLNNCTVVGNLGIGILNGTADNCIAYYNSGGNYSGATLNYCCTTPLPTNGTGNIALEPQMASLSHLSAGSPCIGAGSAAYTSGVDIDSEAWANPPSIGCDEYHVGAVTGPLSVGIQADNTNVAEGFVINFTALIGGRTTGSRWVFDDGIVVSNMPLASHSWSTGGSHFAVLQAYNESYPNGMAATQMVQVISQYYVNVNNPSPAPPYTNWAIAATNIQDAVDVAYPGSVVLVSNGVYQTGGHVVHGSTGNRVAITKPMKVASVNGAGVTSILGGSNTRCVYLTNGVTLVGFTLSGGSASSGSTSGQYDRLGGGIWAEGSGDVVSNCILTGNYANYYGGGTWGGTFINCVFSGNSAGVYAGAVMRSTLINCTVVGNSAEQAGGVENSTLENCIDYYNTSTVFPQTNYGPFVTFINSCTTPDPGGSGNITNEPLLVNLAGSNFHLQPNSPCINSGNNAYVASTTDLDGNPRIVGGTVDIGAYEYQTPTSIISYAWLQQYGLPTDGSVDHADLDSTSFNVYQDWIAGLNPTNELSVLAMLPPVPTNNPAGLVVSWESVNNRTYFLQISAELTAHPPFVTIQSNIVGQTGTTSYMDTNAVGNGPVYYRVGVQ